MNLLIKMIKRGGTASATSTTTGYGSCCTAAASIGTFQNLTFKLDRALLATAR